MPQVMRFLGEVVDIQERIKDRERALNGLPPLININVLPSERTEKISIPPRLKPVVNKEVNFELFTNLLMEQFDVQRTSLSLDEFRKIEFSCAGFPKVVL